MLVDARPDDSPTTNGSPSVREACEPSLIVPGAVIAGDLDATAVAEVVEVVDKPAGPVVHLRVLSGAIEDYEALVRRAITLS